MAADVGAIEGEGSALAARRQRVLAALEEIGPVAALAGVVGAVVSVAIAMGMPLRDALEHQTCGRPDDPCDVVAGRAVDAQDHTGLPTVGHGLKLAPGLALSGERVSMEGVHASTLPRRARVLAVKTEHRPDGTSADSR